MIPVRACIAAVLCILLASTPLAQGGRGGGQRTPARDGQPVGPTGTGAMSGRVTAVDGGPVRRAQVQLTSSDGRLRRTTTTDSEGLYAFTAIPAGQYTIRAVKGGFVDLAFGQTALRGSVPPIVLGEGESLSGLTIVLPRGSVIAGRVTDEFGDPVLQAQVQAFRYQFQPDGEQHLVQGGPQAVTDDLGQFRLYGLVPGDYVVSAITRSQFGPGPRFQQDQSEEGYAPTFYPGTTNPAEAQSVSVGLGQELSLHLQLVPSRLSRVSGVVVDSQGRLGAQGTAVMLRPERNAGAAGVRSGNVGADGTFAIGGIPPGDYVLEVRPRMAARTPGDPSPLLEGEFAVVPVAVGGGDLTGLRIVTGRGTTLSGRVVFEGTPPPPGVRVRVVPQSADPSRNVQMLTRGAPADGVVGSDGAFQLDGLAAPMFLRITLDPGRNGVAPEPLRYMTKSVLVDGVDVADTPLDPARRGSISGVTVVVTDKLTDISGDVSDGRGTPLQGTVLIVPDVLPAGVSPTRFVRVLQTDGNGHFSVRGMPAGRYVAVALGTFDAGHQYDPDVIARARQLGRSFEVREGESAAVDLRLTTGF